ncbi:MAG: hypothetical protein MK009_05915 [Gammaproteobacteria bacterium]|nr:hypothetical protein [Gammaproteobacteria bacterium]
MDVRIEAIREDPCVGRGTCSSIDECWSDDELSWKLNEDGVVSETAAIQWARDYEQIFMEQLLNTRWGGDGDPQLAEYAAWKKKLEDNPIDK